MLNSGQNVLGLSTDFWFCLDGYVKQLSGYDGLKQPGNPNQPDATKLEAENICTSVIGYYCDPSKPPNVSMKDCCKKYEDCIKQFPAKKP